MSGKMRAQVEAQLKEALRASERAQGAIADSQSKALEAMLQQASHALAAGDTDPLRGAAADLAAARNDVPAVAAAAAGVKAASEALRRARNAGAEARREGDQATSLTAQATSSLKKAMRDYERAKAALDKSTRRWELDNEYRLAEQAKVQLLTVERNAAKAAKARAKAAKAAQTALAAASGAASAVSAAGQSARAARAESDERTRAEKEARRIAEAARQRATVAVGAARSALGGLNTADADKFRPGERAKLQRAVNDAQSSLTRGDSAAAERAAAPIPAHVGTLAAAVAAARAEFGRQQAQAQAVVAALDAAINATDATLISSWADDPTALDNARSALGRAQAMITSEHFDDATTLAMGQVGAVDAATVSASETRAAHERRESIGEAVMDVLEEMGFDVSFQPGTRTGPLRISGQTPEEAAADGDFDIEIPLTGEVHFEVTDQEGDGSCAQAVKSLQTKLAERGVGWNTTDWGYGQDPDTRTSTSQQPTPQYTHGDHQQRTYGH